MKFALAVIALIGSVFTQEDDATTCNTVDDCEKNFDAIYQKWEEDEGDEDAEPIRGEMACANMELESAGGDDESDDLSLKLQVCVINKACGIESENEGIKITFNCDEGNA